MMLQLRIRNLSLMFGAFAKLGLLQNGHGQVIRQRKQKNLRHFFFVFQLSLSVAYFQNMKSVFYESRCNLKCSTKHTFNCLKMEIETQSIHAALLIFSSSYCLFFSPSSFPHSLLLSPPFLCRLSPIIFTVLPYFSPLLSSTFFTSLSKEPDVSFV